MKFTHQAAFFFSFSCSEKDIKNGSFSCSQESAKCKVFCPEEGKLTPTLEMTLETSSLNVKYTSHNKNLYDINENIALC